MKTLLVGVVTANLWGLSGAAVFGETTTIRQLIMNVKKLLKRLSGSEWLAVGPPGRNYIGNT